MDVPSGLSALEYSRHICEYEAGIPALTNIKLVADCIVSISKREGVPLYRAYKYMARALFLAKGQGVIPTGEFFKNGEYLKFMVPQKKDHVIVSQERDKICESHGCMSGWVYADKGVVRCQKCVHK